MKYCTIDIQVLSPGHGNICQCTRSIYRRNTTIERQPNAWRKQKRRESRRLRLFEQEIKDFAVSLTLCSRQVRASSFLDPFVLSLSLLSTSISPPPLRHDCVLIVLPTPSEIKAQQQHPYYPPEQPHSSPPPPTSTHSTSPPPA